MSGMRKSRPSPPGPRRISRERGRVPRRGLRRIRRRSPPPSASDTPAAAGRHRSPDMGEGCDHADAQHGSGSVNATTKFWPALPVDRTDLESNQDSVTRDAAACRLDREATGSRWGARRRWPLSSDRRPTGPLPCGRPAQTRCSTHDGAGSPRADRNLAT